MHVDAVQASVFTDQSGNPAPLDTTFSWNFGDPSGEYNVLPGYNAAHIYDVPGTYTATLTLKQGSTTSTSTLSVSVSASSQTAVYISPTGSGN